MVIANSTIRAGFAFFREDHVKCVIVVKHTEALFLMWCTHSQGNEPRVALWILNRNSNMSISVYRIIPVTYDRCDVLGFYINN